MPVWRIPTPTLSIAVARQDPARGMAKDSSVTKNVSEVVVTNRRSPSWAENLETIVGGEGIAGPDEAVRGLGHFTHRGDGLRGPSGSPAEDLFPFGPGQDENKEG